MLSAHIKKRDNYRNRIIENKNRLFYLRYPMIINALLKLTDNQIVTIFNKMIESNNVKLGDAADFIYLLTQKYPDNKEVCGAAMTLLIKASQQLKADIKTNSYYIRYTYLLKKTKNQNSNILGHFLNSGVSFPELKSTMYKDIYKFIQDELIDMHNSMLEKEGTVATVSAAPVNSSSRKVK